MKKLLLIDGNSLLFRAYFAMMRPMITSEGIYTQGIFAFINMLNKLLKEHKPTHIAVAFDMKEKTFRHEKYAEYKAGRAKTPIELLSEIPILHEILEAMNIKVFELPKFEADDIIGTIAKKASSENIPTLIVTGDKDELQLVDENINVMINKKGVSEFEIYDINLMQERYNLTPLQFIDLKGLMGDKSDNIPGVPGVGEKKGISLLTEFENLENVLNNSANIKGKLGENIRDNIEQAKLSKWLATINIDAPIVFNWSDLEFSNPDLSKLINIYTKLEFNKFIKELDADTDEAHIGVDYGHEIESIKETDFYSFIKNVQAGSDVIIDINTDDSHVNIPIINSIALYSAENNLFTIDSPNDLDIELKIRAIADKHYNLIGHDLKKALYSLLSYYETEFSIIYDSVIAEYLIDSNKNKYDLEKMILRYNGCSVDESISVKAKLFYIHLLKSTQFKKLEELKLAELFTNCEIPLVQILAKMELSGINVNKDVLKNIGEELNEKISILESDIYNLAGNKFNINSPKQLASLLFDDLGISYPKNNKGSYSTSAEILEKIEDEHPIVSKVLEYRKLTKLNSTYVIGIIDLIAYDGKIHPHFQQTVTSTGRLSCVEPNLQNIPVRDDYGRLIRKAFIAGSNNVFVGSDYSQIELRVMASLSEDETMLTAFSQGKDIHRATAARVFNIPENQVSSLDRSKAKAVNFGVIYGMSGFGLSENLKISRIESQKYIEDYFEKHAKVKEYLDKQVEIAELDKSVRTYFGRLRYIPEISSTRYRERELGKRLAMNTPIQGTAADIIKFAMVDVYNEINNNNLKSKLILQIHDELILECPENEFQKAKDILENCMENAANLKVKLSCDTHVGNTWFDLK